MAVARDHAEPVAVAVEREAELAVALREHARSGRAGSRAATDRDDDWESVPSTSQNSSARRRSPGAGRASGANAPATPLPQSTAIFIGRASLTSPTMRSR